jgi:hypothetical protein
MSLWTVVLNVLAYVLHLILSWLGLFVTPFHKLELLWIIIPIWFSWFFAEVFQEKEGTSFGNAISNGVVPFFVGIDWTRFLLRSLADNTLSWDITAFFKFTLCFLVFVYGISVIVFGIKAKQFVHYFGRIRDITYVLLVFSPVIYGVTEMNWEYFLIILLFFPVWYYLIEWLDKKIPSPLAVRKDRESTSTTFNQPPPQTSFPESPSFNQERPLS